MSNDKNSCGNCGDSCSCKSVFSKNVPDCAKFVGVKNKMTYDDVIVELLKKACANKELFEDLRDSINTIQKNIRQCCPSLRQITTMCEPNKIKLTKYRRSLNGLAPQVLPQEGQFLTDLVIKAIADDGIYVTNIGDTYIVSWLDFDDSYFDIALNCEAAVSQKTLQTFTVPDCGVGESKKVALFKKNGVSQASEGSAYSQSFENELLGLGFQKLGGSWLILSEFKWDLTVSCIASGSTTYQFPVICDAGCTYRIPVAGFTKNGVSLNSTAQDFSTTSELLYYLKSFDPNWTLVGNYFVITSMNVWDLTVVCTNCGGSGGTSCLITATYNGSSSGASIYVYYRVNSGAVQNSQLTNGGTISVPQGLSVQIVGLQPVGSNQSEWVITNAGCPNIIENDPTVTVSSLAAFPGDVCQGSILLTASINGLQNYPANTIVIKVDGIIQTEGVHYTKTWNSGTSIFEITTEASVQMLAQQLLCQDSMCACGNGYYEDSTHEVKIIATNAAGRQYTFSNTVTF